MAGGDNGQFDLRALQRVGDVTNHRAEWKRWSFVFKGNVGAASPRLLELMTRVTEQGDITYDALRQRPGPPVALHTHSRPGAEG